MKFPIPYTIIPAEMEWRVEGCIIDDSKYEWVMVRKRRFDVKRIMAKIVEMRKPENITPAGKVILDQLDRQLKRYFSPKRYKIFLDLIHAKGIVQTRQENKTSPRIAAGVRKKVCRDFIELLEKPPEPKK